MSELDDFRSVTLVRQTAAEEAMIRGDASPRMDLWSRRDPVSLLGAWGPNKTGWDELSRIFDWVAKRLAETTNKDFRFDVEVVEVSGDMAYTVGFERFSRSANGGPFEPYTVRVTHVYRREDGEWKIVHRHGDVAPLDESPPAE